MTHRIYGLHSSDGNRIRYIGVTSGSIVKRSEQHARAARSGSTLPVHRWLRKLAASGLQATVILLEETEDRLRECYWIKHYRSLGKGLLNCTDGGDGNHSASSIARIAAAKRGKPRSAETVAKMSAALKGKKMPSRTVEHRANLSAAQKGKPKSPEAVAKTRAALKGSKMPPRTAEHRAKLRASNLRNNAVANLRRGWDEKVRTNPPAGKVGPEQVRAIRLLAVPNDLTYEEIGMRFGIKGQAVGKIVRRQTWSFVE